MGPVHYLDKFQSKVIAQEAKGGAPVEVSLVIPTITVTGQPFLLKIALMDKRGFPSFCFSGEIIIEHPEDLSNSIHIKFERDRPAIAMVEGMYLKREGFYRFKAILDDNAFYSNPTRCGREERESIYWGDPHIHSVMGNCHPDTCRTINFAYVCGQHLSFLDWISVTDHVSNGRCDYSRYKEESITSNLYNQPGKFVALPGYEASLKGGEGGDINVYMTEFMESYVDHFENGNVKTLCDELAVKAEEQDVDFFVISHHTTRSGKHGEIRDAIYPGPEKMPAIEVHSTWGTSEYRGNPTPLKKIHPGPSYAVDMLGRGLMLGFVAGTDTHRTMTFMKGFDESLDSDNACPGITAVRTKELTRQGIFTGIKERNCYGASLERIYLNVTVAGHRQGEIVNHPLENAIIEIDIDAAAQSDIIKVHIIRNGKTLHTQSLQDWKTCIHFVDQGEMKKDIIQPGWIEGQWVYYYVRVACSSGARAWSSPVWMRL